MLKFEDMYDILKKACLAAGQIQLEHYHKKIKVNTKSNLSDLVTEVDLASQQIIIEIITKEMVEAGYKAEEIGFIGEEGVDHKAKHLFIIDPLDGTGNYVEGNDAFSVSIGYLKDGEIEAGMVYVPIRDALYFAEKGKGATLEKNGVKSELKSVPKSLDESKVLFNTASWPEVTEKILKAALTLVYKVRRVRESRSAVLTLLTVPEGVAQACMLGRCMLWDIAAAKIIIDEAGDIMTDWQGNEIIPDINDVKKQYEVVVSQKDLLREVVDCINN